MDALADTIRTGFGSADPPVQVESRLNPNPSPPSVDMYPADPFTEQTGFSVISRELYFTVRARVNGDQQAEQDFLLELMGPGDDNWFSDVIAGNRSLSGTVSQVSVQEGPSGFRQYQDAGGEGSYLGCEWRIRVIP